MKQFSELGLSPELLKAIDRLGFEQASPIQAEAIPLLMAGHDLVGQSQTGSGKTAAFGIPALERTDAGRKEVQVLILCPTRELAVQVSEEMYKLAAFKRGMHALPIYGGQSYDRQIYGLKQGAQIVIGTPGRVMDHMRRGTLRLETVGMVILDEADVMLDMGFKEDIETILQGVPAERQTVFFSATMPAVIRHLIEQYSREPKSVSIERKTVTVPTVEQVYYEVDRRFKVEVLTRLIDLHDLELGIIFCNTKRMVEDLADHLEAQGYAADRLHGDMSQVQRDRVMNKFRKSGLEFLVATDVAARGIDVNDLQVVFNYDMPYDVEDYVHRIGRTGRAGKSGRAISFVSGREVFRVRNIERFTNMRIQRGRVPTLREVEDARQNFLLEELRETLKAGVYEQRDHILERLLEEGHTTTDVAMALLHRLLGGGDGEDQGGESEDGGQRSARPVKREGVREEGQRGVSRAQKPEDGGRRVEEKKPTSEDGVQKVELAPEVKESGEVGPAAAVESPVTEQDGPDSAVVEVKDETVAEVKEPATVRRRETESEARESAVGSQQSGVKSRGMDDRSRESRGGSRGADDRGPRSEFRGRDTWKDRGDRGGDRRGGGHARDDRGPRTDFRGPRPEDRGRGGERSWDRDRPRERRSDERGGERGPRGTGPERGPRRESSGRGEGRYERRDYRDDRGAQRGPRGGERPDRGERRSPFGERGGERRDDRRGRDERGRPGGDFRSDRDRPARPGVDRDRPGRDFRSDRDRPARPGADRERPGRDFRSDRDRPARPGSDRDRPWERKDRGERADRSTSGKERGKDRPVKPQGEGVKKGLVAKASRRTPEGQTRLHMNVGKEAGISPNDVVNAVSGETGLPGSVVGTVDVRDRHLFADVKSEHARAVMAKLNRGLIKGNRVKVKKAD